MADFSTLLSPENILQFAGMKDAMGWIGVGISFLLNVLIGGVILVAILEILGHHWGEHVNPLNAFFAVFVANLVNIFGVVGILSSILPLGYYGSILISLGVWIALIKVFFSELSIKHATIAAVAVVAVNMLVLPVIVGFAYSFFGI